MNAFESISGKDGYAATPWGASRTPPATSSDDISSGIFESSPDCVKVLDLQGRLLRMNRNGQWLMEIEEFGDLVGVAWQSLWPAASRKVISAALAQAKGGEISRFQAECPTAKGKQKWWDVSVNPIRRDGVITHLLSVSRDVTELVQGREKAEEARRVHEASNHARAAFAASISHEIRTPLNAILGFAQLLLKVESDPQKLKSLEKIHLAGQRLVSVVDDMLDLSVADAGKLVLSERDFRLRDVLERVKQGAEDAALNRSLRVTVMDQANITSPLSGDPARLLQVLVNGANNAMRLARNEIGIVVRVEGRSAEMVQLRFEVTNDGAALSQD